ncbi:MAG TPA: ABC transporter permease [Vicinamibacterales bacterium]|nr:ABC transporter permease [Vicinamibacterales bacterium]
MTTIWTECRAAARLALRQPLYSAAVIGILAAAIGSSIAIFSILNAVVLRPLPYERSGELVWLTSIRPDGTRGPFSIQDYVDLRERRFGATAVAAFANWGANATGGAIAERLQAMRVSANAFEVLGVHAAVGRVIASTDADRAPVVVLTHALWLRRYGADPSIIGRVLTLNDVDYTIVGVLPPSFVAPIRDSELAVPIVEADVRRVEGGVNFLRLVARLEPGVSAARASAALTTIARELQAVHPQANIRKVDIGVTPLHEQIVGDYDATLRLLLAAVLMVLLLASVNLASLSIARTSRRRRELAVRAALGVSRSRLAVQLFMETFILAVAAGAAGLLLATWETEALLAWAPAAMPRSAEASIDSSVVAFAIAMTLMTAAAVGLWPAISVSRVGAAADGRDLDRTTGDRRSMAVRRALVAAEVAISLVLAVTTALLVESLRRVQQVDPGFSTAQVLSVRLSLPRARYDDLASIVSFQERLEERFRALPGVTRVGGASLIPLSGLRATVDFVVDGRPYREHEVPEAEFRAVSRDYFDTMGIAFLAGRRFDPHDRGKSAGVAIVNSTLANRFFPGERAVGRRLHIEPGNRQLDHVVEIVGVVGDVKHYGLDAPPTFDLYVPFTQFPESSVVWLRNNQFWMLRTDGNPLALAPAARAALASVDGDVPASAVRTLEQAIDTSLAVRRFNAWLVAMFGYAALVLTLCGIYAVSAHAVAARSRELAIRAALGAAPRGLIALVLRTDFMIVAIGLAVGLVAARAAAGAVTALLFDLRAGDPRVYAMVTGLVATVGAGACYVPALRAARADPSTVLRGE